MSLLSEFEEYKKTGTLLKPTPPTELVEPKEEPKTGLLTKAAQVLLPKSLEYKFGITKKPEERIEEPKVKSLLTEFEEYKKTKTLPLKEEIISPEKIDYTKPREILPGETMITFPEGALKKISEQPILKAALPEVPEKDTLFKKIARFVLPKSLELKFGLRKPTTAEEIWQWGKDVDEYYGRGEDLIGGVTTFGKGLVTLNPFKEEGNLWKTALLQASQGHEGASVVDRDWANRYIKDADMDFDKFVSEVTEKYKNKLLVSGFPLKITDIAEFPRNLVFSVTSMMAGLGIGVPIGIIPLPGARAAAWTLGTAASGKVAYEMTTYQIMQQYLEAKNEEKISKSGNSLTSEEEKQLKDEFSYQAMKYGLWEAVPEAISNLAFVKLLTAPLLKMGISKTIVGNILTKITGLYGEELLTETITQKGQSAIEVEAGLREGRITWTEAFKEVAPQTFLLTTVMAGAGSTIIQTQKGINKITNSLKNEIGEKHPLYNKIKNKVESEVKTIKKEEVIPVAPEKELTDVETGETIKEGSAQDTYLKTILKPAEYSARIIEKKLGGEEALRQSQKGAMLLREQLTKEEKEAKARAEEISITELVDMALGRKKMPEEAVKPVPEPQKGVAIEPEAKKGIISPELQPLAQEARKYKSAEEFVNSQAKGKPLYHGTTEVWEGKEPKFNLYLTEDKAYAQHYADNRVASSITFGKKGGAEGTVVEYYRNPKAKVLDVRKPEHLEMIDDYWRTESTSGAFYPSKRGLLDWTEAENLSNYITEKKLPFDAILIDEGGIIDPLTNKVKDRGIGYVALNKNAIVSKSQLTDIYNQAIKGVKEVKPEVKPKEVSEETEISKLNKAKTGEKITITAYAGIKNGKDSGFRSPSKDVAQAYSDIKGGQESKQFTDTLNNPYVAEDQNQVLKELGQEDMLKEMREEVGRSGGLRPDNPITIKADNLIKTLLSEKGYDSVVYTQKGRREPEYQIFKVEPEAKPKVPIEAKEIPKPEVEIKPEEKVLDVFEGYAKVNFDKPVAKLTATELRRTILENKGEVFEDKGGTLINKVGSWQRGIEDKERVLNGGNNLIGGYEHGIFTDAFVLIKDKKIVTEIFDSLFTKEAKGDEGVMTKLKNDAKEMAKDFPQTEEMTKEVKGEKAEIEGHYVGVDYLKLVHSILSNKKTRIAVNSDKLAFMKKYLPDADIYVSAEKEPVQFVKNNKVVGLLMPIMAESIPTISPKPKGIAQATLGEFAKDTEVKLGSMDKIRPVEFPELVEIANDLMGRVPEVSKRLRRALGKFYGVERGKIKLRPDLFKKENFEMLTKTLAHEIGHLVDYLPHQTLKRGNLLGSLLSLRSFLKNQYGEIEVTNKEVREELKAVSQYWRPWEEATATPSYKNYRNSARELYADAVSVLFNSPGTLETMAPTFYESFFKFLDEKTEVKEAYFNIQEVLSHDRETLIARRRERVQEMFDQADFKAKELQEIKESERRVRLKDFWNMFTYGVKSINQPIYNKVKELQKKGVVIPDEQNPEYLLSGRNYLSGRIKGEFKESVQPIMKNLFENNIDWKTFGEFLFYERIIEGDRSEFANPKGITPKAAEELRESVKQSLGERYKIIEESANKFRGFLKKLAEEAYSEGMFTKEMFDVMKGNEKYVPFQVLEYMENYVVWRTKPQVGTLKDVNNPANSLLLKAVSTIRAIENQKDRVATFKMLEENYSDEIQDAPLRFTGKAQVPVESRDPKFRLVTYYKEGKLRGKYIDPYIATSLEKDTIGSNRAVMTIFSPLRYLNKKYYRPVFVVYNAAWIPFNFIRDFMRFWKNIPGMSMYRAVKLYGKALRPARVRVLGPKEGVIKDIEAEKLITKLEKEKLLSVTWNDFLMGQTTEDVQIEAVFEKMGLAESKKEIPTIRRGFDKILKYTGIGPILNGIRKTGEIIETMPKVAGYYALENKMGKEEMATFIRRNVGSPDFFEKGYLTAATNDIFLFSNAFIQAVSADANIATDPKTRSGFWWKTAKVTFLPKILMFLALMGVFGEWLKKRMEDASEYDLTNYMVIPIGKDDKNGKTAYLRIPQDETSRFLGGLLWKTMYGFKNDQNFVRDMKDVASLFGGQLPSLTPAISSPLSAAQFAMGQNPYDSFRGRQVLTEQQFKAGGWYALKPFLLWQFQQSGGNIFMKFYAGEQTPTEKSVSEKFLQVPVISNVVGRFLRISDYGAIEKYREKTSVIQQEQARKAIDETRIINDYVKKYQKDEGTKQELYKQMVPDILGHIPKGDEEIEKAKRLKKKFEIAILKGKADPIINSFISAWTNEEKVILLKVFREDMSDTEFLELKKTLYKYKIVSKEVLNKVK